MFRSRFLLLFGALAIAAWPCQITLPEKPDALRFAVIGDSGTGSRAQYDVAKQMADCYKAFAFQFVIMNGDNIYGSQGPKDFKSKFEEPYKPLLDAGVKFYA